MKIGEKIIVLRKEKGYSQEELASMLDVSRQSVSKWELNTSIPDLDKIIKLSEIFQVSVDSLVKEEEIVYEADSFRRLSDEEVERFLALKADNRLKTAIGVSLCILSPIVLIAGAGSYALGYFHSWLSSEEKAAFLGIIVLLVLVGIGVALLIMASASMSRYDWLEKEPVKISLSMRKKLEAVQNQDAKKNTMWMTIGVCLCILSVIPLFVSLMINEKYAPFGVAALLLLVSLAVFLFIYFGMMKDALEMLLQEGEYSIKEKQFRKEYSYFPGAYWCVVTAIYLLWSFISNQWEKTWLVFAVAGVLYAAIIAFLKARADRR